MLHPRNDMHDGDVDVWRHDDDEPKDVNEECADVTETPKTSLFPMTSLPHSTNRDLPPVWKESWHHDTSMVVARREHPQLFFVLQEQAQQHPENTREKRRLPKEFVVVAHLARCVCNDRSEPSVPQEVTEGRGASVETTPKGPVLQKRLPCTPEEGKGLQAN